MRKLFKIIIFIMFILPLETKAATNEIVAFNLEATVDLDRTVKIEEEQHIYFVEDIKYLKKIINKKTNIVRPNGSIQKINTTPSDVFIYETYSTKQEKDNKLNIEFLANGIKDNVKEYKMSYTLNYGNDKARGYDEFYLDIIDGNYDVDISNINFKITFPSSIENQNINFLLNNKYSLTSSDLEYKVKDNMIYGVLQKTLEPNEKLSIRIELPEKYFASATDNYNFILIATMIIPICSLIYSIFLWNKYKKNNKVIGEISSDIPCDYDPVEIIYLYRGYTKESDFATLLITLANKGYIRFEEEDDGYKLGKANSFKIIKQKDYDLNNAAQKLIFDKLFEEKEEITIKDIEYNLFDTLMQAKNTIDNKKNKSKLFHNEIKNKKTILLILTILSIIAITAYPSYLYINQILFVPIVSLLIFGGLYILFILDKNIIIKIILGMILLGFGMYIVITPIINEILSIVITLIGMIIISISLVILHSIPLRTKYGNKMLGTVLGFKSGLCSLTKNNLQEKLKENQNYYYDMYPYVYLFNITDEWKKKGLDIVNNYPNWYATHEEFSLDNFEKFIKNMLLVITQSMCKNQTSNMSSIHVEYVEDNKVKQMNNS